MSHLIILPLTYSPLMMISNITIATIINKIEIKAIATKEQVRLHIINRKGETMTYAPNHITGNLTQEGRETAIMIEMIITIQVGGKAIIGKDVIARGKSSNRRRRFRCLVNNTTSCTSQMIQTIKMKLANV